MTGKLRVPPGRHHPLTRSHASTGKRRGPDHREPSASARASVLWAVAAALAILPLLWACRGAPLGIPVVDDYIFLAEMRFRPPIDWLGPMGSPYYWRPVGRQLYFALLGGTLIERPWVAATVHALLFVALALVLYRIARHRFAPPVAAALASFPLLGEPARLLLGWPSGAMNLIALLCVATAVHETLAGRPWTTAVAALAGVLSHEAATLVLPALVCLAWWRKRRRADLLLWAGIALGVGAIETWGHAIARTHGMGMPSDAARPHPWEALPAIVGRALTAQLNLEDRADPPRTLFLIGYIALFAVAVALVARRDVRPRLRVAAPALVGGAAWFAAGLIPLLWVWPDWNGWRTTLPGLGLGVAAVGLLGLAWPPLAAGFVALRLAALLTSESAPPIVAVTPPPSVSQFSFARLVRIQRTVESTRAALRSRFPDLPRGASVRYWGLPLLTEIGFQSEEAVRVWYADSTIHWGALGGFAGLRADAVVEFLREHPWPARVVEPRALRMFDDAVAAQRAGNVLVADSMMAEALDAQPGPGGPFRASLLQNRARMAQNRGDFAHADSLNRICLQLDPGFTDAWALAASLALQRGDRGAAIDAVSRCLALDARHEDGLRLAAMLRDAP